MQEHNVKLNEIELKNRIIKKDNVKFFKVIRKIIKYALKHPVDTYKSISYYNFKPNADFAIKADGGIGDILRANVLLKAFYKSYPEITFDVFLNNPQLAPLLFGALPNVKNCHYEYFFHIFKKKYSAKMRILQISQVLSIDSKKVPTQILQTRKKVNNWIELYDKYKETCWREIINQATLQGKDFLDVLGLTAGIEDMGDKKALLPALPPNPLKNKNYITFSSSSNPRDKIGEKATKCWPLQYWQQLITLIKKAYPDLEIIQLGQKNATPVKNANTLFLGRTSLKEAASILSESKLHLDCDCGNVHLAYAVGTKSLVLFGPTLATYVGYKDNINIQSQICNNCWHSTETWNTKCPLEYNDPVCMKSITPQQVFSYIKTYLSAL